MPLDEHRFPVKHIDLGIRHFSMDQQRHADGLHPAQDAGDLSQVGHTGGWLVVALAG